MLDPQSIGPGEEQYERFKSSRDFKRKEYCQYDYRDTDGELFSCVSTTLNACKDKRDKWLKAKNEGSK